MSHKSTSYSANLSPKEGYALTQKNVESAESYSNFPGQPGDSGSPYMPPPNVHAYGMQSGYQHNVVTGYPQPGPIMQQPSAQGQPGGWMNIPQGLSNCPPGLEYLSMIDQLLVHQEIEFSLIEANNKYIIKNILGQKVYYAKENTDCCSRICCGPIRDFEMEILDNFGKEVIHLRRPLSCCLPSLEVSVPHGAILGSVEQQWSLCRPTFLVRDAAGDTLLQIRGPIIGCGCDHVDFKIFSKDGQIEVGRISKLWSGLARELFTTADNFGISFPMDLDVRIKAVLLGACLLIDFIYYERK